MLTFNILEAETAKYLAAKINSALEKGWKIHGNTFFANNKFYQPITITQAQQKNKK